VQAERLFAAIRQIAGRGLTQAEVNAIIACFAGETPRRTINAAGLQIVKVSEGLRLAAYLCPAKIWTIGYGSTGAHVKKGLTITAAQAEALLLDDLKRFENGVARLCTVATENQFSAMVSLAFNIGLAAFENSTLLKKHLAGDYAGAAKQFSRWNQGGGKVLAGLVKRRAAEAVLYLT